jgi:hypothetical protein
MLARYEDQSQKQLFARQTGTEQSFGREIAERIWADADLMSCSCSTLDGCVSMLLAREDVWVPSHGPRMVADHA